MFSEDKKDFAAFFVTRPVLKTNMPPPCHLEDLVQALGSTAHTHARRFRGPQSLNTLNREPGNRVQHPLVTTFFPRRSSAGSKPPSWAASFHSAHGGVGAQ